MGLVPQALASAHERPVDFRHRQLNPGRPGVVALMDPLGFLHPVGRVATPAVAVPMSLSGNTCAESMRMMWQGKRVANSNAG